MADQAVAVRLLLKRAETLLRQLQYERARMLAREAVALAPQNWKAWHALRTAWGYLGGVQELENAFEQALRLVPTPWDELETWCARGNAENNADAWEAALRSFARVAELEPEWCFPWVMRGIVLGNMGTFIDQRYHEDVLVALDHALTCNGLRTVDERIVYALKATSLSCLGRREEAERCAWKAAALQHVARAEEEDAVHRLH